MDPAINIVILMIGMEEEKTGGVENDSPHRGHEQRD